MIKMDDSFCPEICAGDTSFICGGDYGAISVYPNYPANSMTPIEVLATLSGDSVTGIVFQEAVLDFDTFCNKRQIQVMSCTFSWQI